MTQDTIPLLFDNNRAWAEAMHGRDPTFFQKLSCQQSPDYFWIGCSDSRVPANELLGLLPGELFVHRNIANVVSHSDFNGLSVVQFAVDVLRVKHIFVVGHDGCSGVSAVLNQRRVGLANYWLRHVNDVAEKYAKTLATAPTEPLRLRRLCELNTIEQLGNLSHTPIVQDAWAKGQPLTLHGWVYGVHDGLIRDLGVTANAPGQWEIKIQKSLQRYA